MREIDVETQDDDRLLSLPSRLTKQIMASLIIDTQPIPSGSSITLDGSSSVVGPRFRGISGIPPGWHLLSYSLSSSTNGSSEPSFTSSGIDGVRHSVLRYFQRDEIVLRRWDATIEMIQPILSSQTPEQPHSLSFEQLQSYQSMLAPYPIHDLSESSSKSLETFKAEAIKNWAMVTASLNALGEKEGRRMVARIFGPDVKESGFDSFSGDAKLDSLSELWSPATTSVSENGRSRPKPHEMAALSSSSKETTATEVETHVRKNEEKVDSAGRLYWGTPRPQEAQTSVATGSEITDEEGGGRPIGSLQFTNFDLRRSWPQSCSGEERTRWSVDKSWLLQDVLQRSGGPSYLLAELELSFLLFFSSHNPYCMDHFKLLTSLFACSGEIMGAPSSFEAHPAFAANYDYANLSDRSSTSALSSSTASPSANVKVMPSLHASLLRVLASLFKLLPPDFFSSQADPETMKIESGLITDLLKVRRNIGSALSSQASRARQRPNFHSSSARDPDSLLSQELTSLIPAWRSLSHLCSAHFGWHLDSQLDEEVEVREESAVIKASAKQEEDDETTDGQILGEGEGDEEDDEDLPVVVDLDAERRGWL